jgi:hypothetical protein
MCFGEGWFNKCFIIFIFFIFFISMKNMTSTQPDETQTETNLLDPYLKKVIEFDK